MSKNDENGSGSALDRYLQKKLEEKGETSPSVSSPSSASVDLEPRQQASASTAAISGQMPAHPELNLNMNSLPSSEFAPAGFWVRFAAFVLDGLILGSILSVFKLIILGPFIALAISRKDPSVFLENSGIIQVANWLLSAVGWYFYCAWFYKNKGATPGKMAMGLKVIDNRQGVYLSYGQTASREIVGKFCSYLFLIGFIMAAFTKNKMALHDMIANSRVVRTRK